MPSVGFAGAWGNQAMADAQRQRMIDELNKTVALHGMSVDDQKLALEKQRYDQEAQDRALLRSQQGAAFNEKIAEGTATNLGAGPSIISPALAERFKNTTLAPLVKPDETLPSTQIASGMAAPGSADTSTASTVTSQAPQLTGQFRFMGTPAANKQEESASMIRGILRNPKITPEQTMAIQAEQAGLKVPANVWEQKPPTSEPLEQVQTPTGPKYVPRGQAIGATPYHAPQQPVIVQTDSGFQSVNRGTNTATPVTDAAGNALKPKTGQTVESRLQSAQAVTQTGNDIIKALSDPNVASKLGPAMSRYNSVADFVGNPPPEFSNLAGLIESYSLANMGVHGMRSNTGAEAIKNTLGLNRHTPESIIATIQGLNGFANHFMENNGMTPAAVSHETVGPPTPASAAWKVLKK